MTEFNLYFYAEDKGSANWIRIAAKRRPSLKNRPKSGTWVLKERLKNEDGRGPYKPGMSAKWADFIEENMQIIYEKKSSLNPVIDSHKSCVKGLREIADIMEGRLHD